MYLRFLSHKEVTFGLYVWHMYAGAGATHAAHQGACGSAAGDLPRRGQAWWRGA